MIGNIRIAGIALLIGLSSVAATDSAWAQKTGKTAATASEVGTHDGYTVIADPGNATGYRGQDSTMLNIEVTGTDTGAVWGDGIYTDDSAIAAAAVHVGLISVGQTAVVTIEIAPGMSSYGGATANGVTSQTFGEFDGSYRFINADMIATIPVDPTPSSISTLRDQAGLISRFKVTGTTQGQIWGDGIYTDDSPLATAAVHEGIIKDGETAIVAIEVLPGLDSYSGSERNGVTSSQFGKFDGSYRLLFSYPL